MTQCYYEKDADLSAIAGQTVAVAGYGNQGRLLVPVRNSRIERH